MIFKIEMPAHAIEKSFEEMFGSPTDATPAVDVAEYDDRTEVIFELPGVSKEDIRLLFEENVLSVTGERKPSAIPEDAKILVHEQHVRQFKRSVRVSHQVESGAIEATLENGVLTVVLPKVVAAKPRAIVVK